MQVYLVGGAVRDELLGRPVGERDWVVVGATAEEMTRLGYKRVGRDFPVFLHPETHEEYALARQERKVAPGYRGFVIEFSPEVTLEQDLLRRDLTINAMARAADGRLIDPFGGEQDLKARVLRHVSPAFAEDPVRILRTARFAARLAGQGFEVAPETLTLMRRMSAQGEVDALVPERVWQETERALREASPEVFFGVLRDCGALERIFPELDALYGVPQPPKWHPEIDTGVHTMMVLKAAARLSPDSRMRFAALTHDLGKGQTPRELWPKHHGHEARSVALVNGLCDRLRIPNDFRELALLVAEYHGLMHRAFELRSETLLKLLERTDALRRAERFELFLLACEADARGRTGFEEDGYAQGAFLRRALATIKPVAPAPQEVRELAGPAIAQELRRRRIAALEALERR